MVLLVWMILQPIISFIMSFIIYKGLIKYFMFSPEEAQMLEQENSQLIEQLNNLSNQVDQVSLQL